MNLSKDCKRLKRQKSRAGAARKHPFGVPACSSSLHPLSPHINSSTGSYFNCVLSQYGLLITLVEPCCSERHTHSETTAPSFTCFVLQPSAIASAYSNFDLQLSSLQKCSHYYIAQSQSNMVFAGAIEIDCSAPIKSHISDVCIKDMSQLFT